MQLQYCIILNVPSSVSNFRREVPTIAAIKTIITTETPPTTAQHASFRMFPYRCLLNELQRDYYKRTESTENRSMLILKQKCNSLRLAERKAISNVFVTEALKARRP